MAKQSGAWTFTDLQVRYERAQLLANDCTQDFAGNYFFPSDRSPKGFWTTTRRQPLDYVCDCPDFALNIDQQLTNSALSRWVRADWSTRPDNTQLVNRCIHCFAVAIAEQELDPSFPVNRIYQAKRSRFPKTDCGCGCGGSGGCGCPNKELGLPEPKLIQGCDTDCYVEPLTPRTLRTVPTGEGIPAFQTFEIPTVQFTEDKYRGCSGDTVTITLSRSTPQGFNNATVSGFPVDVQFPFEPEFRTSSQEITLDYPAGNYVIGITAIASGNFGELLEAQLEVFDCANFGDRDSPDYPCPESEFIDFGGGECEGSYFVGFRQTGNINPDGTCEQIKVLDFQEGLDCPFPEPPPPIECESTEERDCSPLAPEPPKCVNTGSGDGFNTNAGFNAVVRVRTGVKTIEYLRPDKKECAEKCEFEERTVFSPSCPELPRKPTPAATCGYAKRYLGWGKFDPSNGDYRDVTTGQSIFGSVGTAIVETFACDDGTIYGLRAYTARCVPPSNRVLDDFAAANYQGNEFGEGCCPFDETKPERPVCPPNPVEPPTKFSCSGGVCSPDTNGIYNSQAECEAALVPPAFTGGQCLTAYKVLFQAAARSDGTIFQQFARGLGAQQNGFPGALTNIGSAFFTDPLGVWQFNATSSTAGTFLATTDFPVSSFNQPTIAVVVRDDGSPDNCGSLPSTCP